MKLIPYIKKKPFHLVSAGGHKQHKAIVVSKMSRGKPSYKTYYSASAASRKRAARTNRAAKKR